MCIRVVWFLSVEGILQTCLLGCRVVWVKVLTYPHACGMPWGEKEGLHQHLGPQTLICEICLEVPAVPEPGTSYLVHGHYVHWGGAG